jgi:hypothetical protein
MAEDYTLEVVQGTDQQWRFPVTDATGADLDITNWTVHSQIRARTPATEVLYEWSTVDGNATAGAGFFTLDLSATESSAFTWRSGVYDVEITSPQGKTTRAKQGPVKVSPEVTR